MKVALIDNYDSFTYNLRQLIVNQNVQVDVLKNDAFEIEELDAYDKLLFSPGPGIPKDAGKLEEVISRYAETKPMLGVCLGEQAIGEVFGAKLKNLDRVYHGIQSRVSVLESKTIFKNLSSSIQVGRYHSWVVDTDEFPDELRIMALSDEGHIMALRHRSYPIYGIQFHPESILTPDGQRMISNFLFD